MKMKKIILLFLSTILVMGIVSVSTISASASTRGGTENWKGMQVWTNTKGFIHSKVIIIDDKITSTGSANMDLRSFMLNFEINAFMYSEVEAIMNREIFLKDQQISRELTLEAYKKRGISTIMKEGFFRLFAPIM